MESLYRDESTLADAIGAQGAFKFDSNRRLTIQYAVYKEGLKQVQAETLAWRLFQEVLPHQVNMYTIEVSGDQEPNGVQWALIDCYFNAYRKQSKGVTTKTSLGTIMVVLQMETALNSVHLFGKLWKLVAPVR